MIDNQTTTPATGKLADLGERLQLSFRRGLALPVACDVSSAESSLMRQWDSVAHLQLVLAIEDEFGIQLDPADVVDLTSYASAVRILERHGIGLAPERGFLKSGCDPGSKAFLDADTGEWFTRAQLSSRVTAFADLLRFPAKALGFHFAFNDGDSLIAYLAAIEAGHAVVMLNPELDAGLKSGLIARFRPDFIVAPQSHAPESPPEGPAYSMAPSPHPGQLLLRCREPQRCPIHPDLTLLNSTSGSTGSPKLVRLSWRNLESSARQIVQGLGITERDRNMITAPIFNAYGQAVIHTHLLAGGVSSSPMSA